MILGALIALGVDEEKLVGQLRLLDVAGFEIEISTKDKSGISATHAEVKIPNEKAHRHLHHIEKIINDSRLADSVKKRAGENFQETCRSRSESSRN